MIPPVTPGAVAEAAARRLAAANPAVWDAAVRKYGAMSRGDAVEALRKEYRSLGLDIDAVARSLGVRL